ncbi:hypothetical protein JW926_18355 [Candidatus Sumerlaeota bacterium]|nr:hypothetical protein [Candidatus Sumerlaeota bacterium]
MLNLKSLIWCLSKDRHRYNLRLVLDSIYAKHIPVSIQGTPLGRNLTYLIHEMSCCEGLYVLLNTLKKLPGSEIRINTPIGELELGHYLKTRENIGFVPKDSYGVVSFLGSEMRGLFYDEKQGMIEASFRRDQVEVHYGTSILPIQ